MRKLCDLPGDTRAAAAAELALILPLMLILMFGSMELGNLFLTQHALTKQVRDGARYASRIPLSDDYACSEDDLGSVFKDGDAAANIVSVTQRGSLDSTAVGRFSDAQWADSCEGDSVQVSIRCVAKGTTYKGVYAELEGDIPVVKVAANIAYQPILANAIAFDNAGICLTADSELAVAGL